jgi:hypothetical protein
MTNSTFCTKIIKSKYTSFLTQKTVYWKIKEDRPCTIAYHWKAFVQPSLQWKSNTYYIFWVYVCSQGNPAWNAHVQCCVACLTLQYFFQIFPQTARISKKKIIEYKIFVFSFSAAFIWNNPQSNKTLAGRDQKRIIPFHVKCPSFLSGVIKLEFFSTDFRKIVKRQILWKSVQ